VTNPDFFTLVQLQIQALKVISDCSFINSDLVDRLATNIAENLLVAAQGYRVTFVPSCSESYNFTVNE